MSTNFQYPFYVTYVRLRKLTTNYIYNNCVQLQNADVPVTLKPHRSKADRTNYVTK